MEWSNMGLSWILASFCNFNHKFTNTNWLHFIWALCQKNEGSVEIKQRLIKMGARITFFFFSFGATAHLWALAYLHETFRFTSVY
jgi:hypothetical protein